MLKSVPEMVAEARANLRCINAETAMAEIQENNGTIIDVRELIEVEHLAAPHSVNIPRGVLEMKVGEVLPNSEQPVYLHCATGGRATFAAQQLVKMGYSNVTVITCPIDTVRQHQEAAL